MENNKKRVGVFMQLYRNEPSMHRAIESVLRQTYKNLRFYILVSSATRSIIAEYVQRDSRIEMLEGKPGENVRYYDKHIAGDDNAYFTVIDGDDWYENNYIEELVEYAEKNAADVVACGNFFVNIAGERYCDRKQKCMVWDVENTGQILPYMYDFYRTLWGKMINSEVIRNYSAEGLPESAEYGGYGGDTITMFRWLMYAKRIGICDKVLYNYTVSPMGGSGVLKEGRLDSDALLYRYIKGVLEVWGEVGEYQERFLFQVYGEALKDTTKLVMKQKVTGEVKAEMLLYIYENELTKILFDRVKEGALWIAESPRGDGYVEVFLDLLFSDVKSCVVTSKTAEIYLKLFEILYVKWEGLLSVEEFTVLLSSKKMLDNFVKEQYGKVFAELLGLLRGLKLNEARTCLQILRRVTAVPVLKAFLQEKRFVLNYAEILQKINEGENEEAFLLLKASFDEDKLPYEAEQVVQLWIHLAAALENADEFIFGKELGVEILFRNGKVDEAKMEYEELVELGVLDQNMENLASMLKRGL